MSLDLVIPDPSPELVKPGQLEAIAWEVQARLPQMFEPELVECDARLAAIDTYLQATSTAGRQLIAETRIALTVRIGELLGPATTGRPEKGSASQPFSKDQRRVGREAVSHPEIVERVRAAGTDAKPSTNSQIHRAVRATSGSPTVQVSLRLPPEIADWLDAQPGSPSATVIALIRAQLDGPTTRPRAPQARPTPAEPRPATQTTGNRLAHRWLDHHPTFGTRCSVCGQQRNTVRETRSCPGPRH